MPCLDPSHLPPAVTDVPLGFDSRLCRFVLGAVLVASSACRDTAQEPMGGPGTFDLALEHGGEEREAVVHVPDSYSSDRAVPLVLNFHGFGGTAASHMEWADMRPQAAEEGFILVYPQGSLLDGEPHWNTSPPGPDNKSSADDFGFVEALIDEISGPYAIDADRIYVAGYSNGAMFSFGLACYRSDLVAAVASVSGAMLDDVGELCTPPPTSVITLHGTADEVLSYDGGIGFRSAEGVVDYWLDVNGIEAEPETDAGANQVESFRYLGGVSGTEVHHHRVVGGGHVWFELEGADTGEWIWDFVSRFGRDGLL